MSEPRQTDAPPEWWEEFEAAANGVRAGSGYTTPPPRGMPDLTPLIALVDAMRRVVPLELQEQVNALQRELLLTIRALIDWYLERLDNQPKPTVVEDIPIEQPRPSGEGIPRVRLQRMEADPSRDITPPAEQAPAAAREIVSALSGLASRELSITDRFTDKTRQTFALALGFFTIVQTVAFNSFQAGRIHHLERTWLFALAMAAIAFLFLTAGATVAAERLVTVDELSVDRLLKLLALANAGDSAALVYLASDYARVVQSQRESNEKRRSRYAWTVRMASFAILVTTAELVSALAFRI